MIKLNEFIFRLKHGHPSYLKPEELEKINKYATTDELEKIEKPVITSKLARRFNKDGDTYFYRPDYTIFDEIIGYDDIKKILKNMVDSEHPVSILLDGSAGCGKSMFLKAIEKAHLEETYYIDGSKATKAGIFNVLMEDEENKIRFLIIDEIDKLNIDDQESLLTLMEDGRLIQTQKNGTFSKTYDNLSVIAASNDKSNMLEPLLTRFFKIKIKDYTSSQFREIGEKVLAQYKLSNNVIDYIITKVLQQPKPNIRTIKQIAKLCNNDINMVDLLIENSG